MDTKQIVGGALALILLGLYTFLVVDEVMIALGLCGLTKADFTSEMQTSLTTIGGLIAALVIAELAVTPPGKSPGARIFRAASAAGGPAPAAAGGPALAPTRAANWVSWIYLLICVVTGVTALVVGWLHADKVPVLTDLGKSWFGLAVAACYSYIGVHP
jgi:hypothetical protein